MKKSKTLKESLQIRQHKENKNELFFIYQRTHDCSTITDSTSRANTRELLTESRDTEYSLSGANTNQLLTAKNIRLSEDYDKSFEVRSESDFKALFEDEEGEDQLDGGMKENKSNGLTEDDRANHTEEGGAKEQVPTCDIVNNCIHQYIEDFLDIAEGLESMQTEYFCNEVEEKNKGALIVKEAINELIKNAEKLETFVGKAEETIAVNWDTWVTVGVDVGNTEGQCVIGCNAEQHRVNGESMMVLHGKMQRQESVN